MTACKVKRVARSDKGTENSYQILFSSDKLGSKQQTDTVRD